MNYLAIFKLLQEVPNLLQDVPKIVSAIAEFESHDSIDQKLSVLESTLEALFPGYTSLIEAADPLLHDVIKFAALLPGVKL